MKMAMRIQQRKRLLTLFLVTVCLTLIVLIVVFSLIFNSVTLNFNTRIPETAPKPLIEGGKGATAIPGVPGPLSPGRALPTDIRVQAPTDEAPAAPRRPVTTVPAAAPGTSGAVPTVRPSDVSLPSGPDIDVAPTPDRPVDIRVQPPAPPPRPTPPQATPKPAPLPSPTPIPPPARHVPPPTDVRGVGGTNSSSGEAPSPATPLPPVPGRG